MAIYIDGEANSLYALQQYQGDETVRLKFKKAFRELKENFFDKGLPVRFRHTKLTYGAKQGRISESYELSTVQNTDQGSKVIRYAESAVSKGNGFIEYRPSTLDWTSRDLIFDKESNIEKALFIWLYICREGKSEDIILIDEHKQAKTDVESIEKSAAMYYFLFNKQSPLRLNEDRLNQTCFSWGIPRANLITTEQKVLKMKVAIEHAEEVKDETRNFAAFEKAMNEGFSAIMEARSAYQIAMDHKKIKYFEQKGAYCYIDDQGNDAGILLKIPTVKSTAKLEYLCERLAEDKNLLTQLKDCIDDVESATAQRKPVVIPDVVDRAYLDSLLVGKGGFNQMQKMLTSLGSSWKGKNKEEIHEELINYYVTNKKG
jgi:hypothetical protein